MQLANAIMYGSFILLTIYQLTRDYDESTEHTEFMLELCMLILEAICIPVEFISVRVLAGIYAIILLFTVLSICLHKEDD